MNGIGKNQIALEALIDAAKAALQHHGVILTSNPPQDAWAHHRVRERLTAALAGIATNIPRHAAVLDESEASNFDQLMHIQNWLISKNCAINEHTEEVDGPLAPAMNIVASIEAFAQRGIAATVEGAA